MGEVTPLIARPPGLPDEVPDAVLLQAVREFMFGAEWQSVATSLCITVQKLHSITRTTQWAVLQNQFVEEFRATEGARMVRMQRKAMDKLEDYVNDGITCWGRDKEGNTFSYQREITPKELVSISLMLNDTNKRLDNLKEGEVDRKKFDGQEIMRDLARFAKARTIDSDQEPDQKQA